MKVEFNLSYYVTKADLKDALAIDTSRLASDLAGLNTKLDELDVDKPRIAPADLSKLSDVLDNYVIKNLCMIDWLGKSFLLI